MTNRKLPITPPPKMVKQWAEDVLSESGKDYSADIDLFAAKAAQWGADQELEACISWLDAYVPRYCEWFANFRAARRPKPRA